MVHKDGRVENGFGDDALIPVGCWRCLVDRWLRKGDTTMNVIREDGKGQGTSLAPGISSQLQRYLIILREFR